MALAYAAAMSCGNDLFYSPTLNAKRHEHTNSPLTDDEKKRIHNDYDRQFHKYVINGEEIIARSKKDAKKIYNQRKVKQ